MSIKSWMLPLEVYDQVMLNNTSYLYDQLSHCEMQRYLESQIDHQYMPPNISRMLSMFPHNAPRDVLKKCIDACLKPLYDQGYVYRTHDVESCKISAMSSNGMCFYLTILICFHKPSRVFGRVVRLQAFYDLTGPHVVSSQLEGVIAEEKIEFTGYTQSMSLSSLSSTSSSSLYASLSASTKS